MRKLIYLCCLLGLLACNRAKHAINKTGETVGQGATEFIRGVSEGVDQTLQCKLALSKELQAEGLQNGKFKVASSDSGDNILTAYLIFNKDFTDTLKAKVYDEQGREYGRAKAIVSGKKDEARYYDFVFDKRTDIEHKSTFVIE